MLCEGRSHAVFDGKEKYIWFTATGEEQLFDLEADPYECHDLSGGPEARERLAVWRERLRRSLCRRGDGLADADGLRCGLLPAVRR